MIDHKTAFPIIPAAGQLWMSTHTPDTLFIFMSHGQLKGIWSDGRHEGEEGLAGIAHGRGGWTRVYPEFHEEDL